MTGRNDMGIITLPFLVPSPCAARPIVTRRFLAILVFAGLSALPASAQQRMPGTGTLVLDGPWKFARGDAAAYASPAFDDRGWSALAVPGEWETANPDYDGFGWYRRQVALPATIEAGEPVGVMFATVGDAYEVYWNGVKIGGRGKFPPSFMEGVDPSLFLVPAQALARARGGRHLLAVRV